MIGVCWSLSGSTCLCMDAHMSSKVVHAGVALVAVSTLIEIRRRRRVWPICDADTAYRVPWSMSVGRPGAYCACAYAFCAVARPFPEGRWRVLEDLVWVVLHRRDVWTTISQWCRGRLDDHKWRGFSGRVWPEASVIFTAKPVVRSDATEYQWFRSVIRSHPLPAVLPRNQRRASESELLGL